MTAQETVRLLPVLSYLDRQFHDVGIELSIIASEYTASAYSLVRRVLLLEHIHRELSRMHHTQWSGPLSKSTGQQLRTSHRNSLVIRSADITLWAAQNYNTYSGHLHKVKKLRVIYNVLNKRLNELQMADSQRLQEEGHKRRLELLFSPRLLSRPSDNEEESAILAWRSTKLMDFGQPYDSLTVVKDAVALLRDIEPVGGELIVTSDS